MPEREYPDVSFLRRVLLLTSATVNPGRGRWSLVRPAQNHSRALSPAITGLSRRAKRADVGRNLGIRSAGG